MAAVLVAEDLLKKFATKYQSLDMCICISVKAYVYINITKSFHL
jgi:hypothetical protein